MSKLTTTCTIFGNLVQSNFSFPCCKLPRSRVKFPLKFPSSCAASRKSTPDSKHSRQYLNSRTESEENETNSKAPTEPKRRRNLRKTSTTEETAVKEFIQKKLGETITSIQLQNPATDDNPSTKQVSSHIDTEEANNYSVKKRRSPNKKMAVDEETPNWPLDSEIGWGIRASEYFEKHGIRNVVDEEGVEVDWEGEIDEAWLQEINCLEWESFAFHPSPLVVLVFERYNNVSVNWKTLKELEKAAQVYWKAKDRLPPRMVKLDLNIEKDLAYALKVRDCPVVLFLRGHRVLYREKEFRNADELVQMIAHFYYNAKRPNFLTLS